MNPDEVVIDHQEFENVSSVATSFQGWNLEVTQVEDGATHSLCRVLRTDQIELLLTRETHSCINDWRVPAGKTTFGFYAPGIEAGSWLGLPVTGNDMLVTGDDRDQFAVTHRHFHSVLVTVSTDLLDRFDALPPGHSGHSIGPGNTIVQMSDKERRLRDSLFRLMWRKEGMGAADVEFLHENILSDLSDISLRLAANNARPGNARRSPSHSLARRAVRAIRHWQKPISPSDLAEELNVSPRLLNLAFNKAMGTSPGRFILRRRLQCVRAELQKMNPEKDMVKQAALANGFNDLGRFAGYYRRMYNELPVETLHRGA